MSLGLRMALALAVLAAAGYASPLQAQQVPEMDYCSDRDRNPRRFCVRLYDTLDPTSEPEAAVYPTLVAGQPANLFSFELLEEDLHSLSEGVGRLTIHRRRTSAPNNDYVMWCSGTLLPGNFVLTAGHCIPGEDDEYVVRATFRLGYRRLNDDRGSQIYSIVGDPLGCRPNVPTPAVCPERANWALTPGGIEDFAVLRLAPNAAGPAEAAFDAAILRSLPLERRASVIVPQHPNALPLHWNFGPVGDEVNASQTAHYVTTFQMSSGSPVFSVRTRALVGVHLGGTQGTCQRRANLSVDIFCTNRFITIEAIAARSPIVDELRRRGGSGQDDRRDRLAASTVVPIVTSRTFASLTAAAGQGDPRSNWILGVKAEYAEDPLERGLLGVPEYAGEPAAEVDLERALQFYQVAADSNFAPALVDLGSFYFAGDVVPQNRTRALELFKRAAELNDPRAFEWLSRLYASGEGGLARDPGMAALYLQMAAEGGAPRSQYDFALKVLVDVDADADEQAWAISFLEQSAESGFPSAQFLLAEHLLNEDYEWSMGLTSQRPGNWSQIIGLLRSAASAGSTEAQLRLDQLSDFL